MQIPPPLVKGQILGGHLLGRRLGLHLHSWIPNMLGTPSSPLNGLGEKRRLLPAATTRQVWGSALGIALPRAPGAR